MQQLLFCTIDYTKFSTVTRINFSDIETDSNYPFVSFRKQTYVNYFNKKLNYLYFTNYDDNGTFTLRVNRCPILRSDYPVVTVMRWSYVFSCLNITFPNYYNRTTFFKLYERLWPIKVENMDLINANNNDISFGNHLSEKYKREDFITISLKLLLNNSTNIMHKSLSRLNQVNIKHIKSVWIREYKVTHISVFAFSRLT